MAKKAGSAYINLSGKLVAKVQEWLQNFGGTGFSDLKEIPQPDEKDNTKVKNFVWSLFDESHKGRAKSFGMRLNSTAINDTKDASTSGENSPAQFWLNCRRLENGQHFDVWGHRYTGPGTEYKAELVDDEIGNQQRIKKAHLLGAWHDISVFPNINNIDDILYWERVKTKFQGTLNKVVTQGLTEGTAFAMSFVNHELERGVPYIDELVLDNEGVLLTPGATGLGIKDKNWYIMFCFYLPKRYAVNKYNLDEEKLVVGEADFFKKVIPQGDVLQIDNAMNAWNQDVPCIRLYLDDYTIEQIPFDPAEADQEHAIMAQGGMPDVTFQQNNRKHINAHLNFLQETESSLNDKTDLTPQEAVHYEAMVKIVEAHIQQHHDAMDMYEKDTGLKADTQLMYPNGRCIFWVGGEIPIDEPVDGELDWRQLFHKYSPEEKAKSVWGRGVPEVLWNTNRNLDLFLSRIADIALVHGNPKAYFNLDDKDNVRDPDNGINNDPQQPAFTSQPPVFRQASASQDNYQLYNTQKANAEKQQGVNQVSYGESPTKDASNQLAETLIQQNQILVTGEPNQNLDLFVTSTMTTRLHMMRQYYTKPRVYFIQGKMKVVNVAKALTSIDQVGDDGQMETLPIPYFQIEVKTGSNLANQWQSDLNMLVGMASTPLADGLPLVPREAVLDHLAERYPQFAVGARYYTLSEALKIGLQVQAEQQKKLEQEQQVADQVKKKLISHGVSQAIPSGGQ